MLKKTLVASIITFAFTSPVYAYNPGEVLVRFGATYQDTGGSIHTGPDSKLREGSMTQLGANATVFVTPHIGIGISATSPFTYTLRNRGTQPGFGSGLGSDHFRLGKVSQLSPTIGAQFFFLKPESRFQPFIGLGLNYTTYDTDLSRTAKDYGYKKIKIDSNWGWVLQAGMDVALNDRWVVNASVQRLDIESNGRISCQKSGTPTPPPPSDPGLPPGTAYPTKASGSGNPACTASKWNADIDPWVYTLSVGFKF